MNFIYQKTARMWQLLAWSRGMIPASGAGGRGFESRCRPLSRYLFAGCVCSTLVQDRRIPTWVLRGFAGNSSCFFSLSAVISKIFYSKLGITPRGPLVASK